MYVHILDFHREYTYIFAELINSAPSRLLSFSSSLQNISEEIASISHVSRFVLYFLKLKLSARESPWLPNTGTNRSHKESIVDPNRSDPNESRGRKEINDDRDICHTRGGRFVSTKLLDWGERRGRRREGIIRYDRKRRNPLTEMLIGRKFLQTLQDCRDVVPILIASKKI